jgi:ribosomal protein S25
MRPDKYWEREGVLRIEAEVRDEKLVKAWSVLCELVGVASATASKALRWMHEQGIIGYFSGKNGVGLRIFLNRAASSIGVRQGQGGQKNFGLSPCFIQ